MLKVADMSPAEMHALLQRESFGHLGCARDGRPYVVPMHYAYDGKDLYFFTTQGMKTQFIEANPQAMPKPWPLAGFDLLQPNCLAAACSTSRSRSSLMFLRRNSSGSRLTACASSSMCDSRAK